MILTILSTFLAPFIGSVLSILASAASVVASSFSAITPILSGLASFVVFFIKSFFTGLGNIVQNLNTLTVIIVVVIASMIYIHSLDTKNLINQVQIQKDYDARHPPHLTTPKHKVTPKPTNTGWDFTL